MQTSRVLSFNHSIPYHGNSQYSICCFTKLPKAGWLSYSFHAMEDYFCLKCLQPWKGRVQDYQDWKRRKCPHCGSRQTVKKSIYDRAVDAVTESLESSPPPLPPLPSSVLFCWDVINETLPDPTLAPRVIRKIYEEAKERLRKRSQANS